jgi:hypothetical protein
MLGFFVAGQGPASFTDIAYYGAMGSKNPVGGEYQQSAMAAQMASGSSGVPAVPPTPVPTALETRRAIAAERNAIQSRIAQKTAERNAAPSGSAQYQRLDREIRDLQKERSLASIAPISDGLRDLVQNAKSYGDLKGMLDQAQMYRVMKMQQAGLIGGPDLSRYKGRITAGYLGMPFSPPQLLGPAGALLGGLLTHILSEQTPLGRSLFNLTSKMIPKMEYRTDSQGRQVAIFKPAWRGLGDVVAGKGKESSFARWGAAGAGLSIAALCIPMIGGLPMLAGVALGMYGVKKIADGRSQAEDNLEKLSKDSSKRSKIQAYASRSPSSFTDDEKKEVAGMLRDYNVDRLDQIMPRLQQHIVNRQLATGEGVERLAAIHTATDLTAGERARKTALEAQDKSSGLNATEREELNGLSKKESVWRDREALGSIFGISTVPGTDVARGIVQSHGSRKLTRALEGRQADLVREDDRTRDSVRLGAGRTQLEQKEASITPAVRQGYARDETLLSYGGASRTDDLAGAKKRDELTDDVGRLERIDRDIGRLTAMQGRVAVGAASASDLSRLEGELTRKYGSEAEKYGTALSPGTTLADLQATQTAMRNGLGQKYAGDMDALGVARSGTSATTDAEMRQLRDGVYTGIGLDQAGDARARGRMEVLQAKNQRPEEFTGRDATELSDLRAYRGMRGNENLRNLRETSKFRKADIDEAQRAGETLIFGDYAGNLGNVAQLQADSAPGATVPTANQARYDTEMDRLGINRAAPDALRQLYDRVNSSREVKVSRDLDAIRRII